MTRRCIPFFVLLLLTQSLLAQKKHSADPFAGLDTSFARVLNQWHVAGFAVAVIQKDSVIYSKGFGYRDYEKKLPVTPHTLFAIGSCTKAFTASLIGLLQKDGQLDIDKPVRDYLPELKFYNQEMNNTITLRDMMCHRTGLPRHDLSWYLFSTSRDSLLRRIQYMEPSATVREKWQYNNLMFMCQGMVAEKLTGQSWENNIKERFFKPLGMDETVFLVKDLQKSTDHALGYNLKKDSLIREMPYHDIYDIGPAGEVYSSVNDLSTWVRTWINGGKFQGKTILPAAYAVDAMTPQVAEGGGLPSRETPDVFFSTYGLGWMQDSYRAHYRVHHSGHIDGFSAEVSFFPTDSIGIVVLANIDGSQVTTAIRDLVIDRLLHLPYKDWSTDKKAAENQATQAVKTLLASHVSDRKPGTHPSHPLVDYTGIYTNPAYGSFEIILKQDSLFALMGTQTWWLKHYHYDAFDPFNVDPRDGIDTTGGGEAGLLFDSNPAGEIASVRMPLEPALPKPIVFTRSPKIKLLSADQLQKYTGEYVIAGVTIKVYTRGDTLLFFVPGQPEYQLANVGPDKFALKALNGYFAQFVFDEKGIVIGLQAIQPNGTFKATRKK